MKVSDRQASPELPDTANSGGSDHRGRAPPECGGVAHDRGELVAENKIPSVISLDTVPAVPTSAIRAHPRADPRTRGSSRVVAGVYRRGTPVTVR